MWLSRNGDFNMIAQNVDLRTCYLTNVSLLLAIVGATSKNSLTVIVIHLAEVT